VTPLTVFSDRAKLRKYGKRVGVPLAVLFLAWNCQDFTPSSFSHKVVLWGKVDPRLELKARVIVRSERTITTLLCPVYEAWDFEMDDAAVITRKADHYRAVIRVAGPRTAIFCNWKVSSVSLRAERGVAFYISFNDDFDPSDYNSKNVVCYSKPSFDCEPLILRLPDALRGEHELDIKLVDGPPPPRKGYPN